MILNRCIPIRALAASLIGLLSSCSDPIGNTYEDVDALAFAPEWKEWVVVGSFGPKGPFTLIDTKLCETNIPCSFSHDGQGHTYDGFDDFELMVLRLESGEGLVSHIVLRSESRIDL